MKYRDILRSFLSAMLICSVAFGGNELALRDSEQQLQHGRKLQASSRDDVSTIFGIGLCAVGIVSAITGFCLKLRRQVPAAQEKADCTKADYSYVAALVFIVSGALTLASRSW